MAIVVVLALLLYNRLTRARNRTSAAWGDVDAELRRRADLVPELNEAVAAYAAHERSVIEAATSARNAAISRRARACAPARSSASARPSAESSASPRPIPS